ncbi:MAG: hypothetical protein JNM41_02910, partial [Flavipsychrobacter sp.]|nr:hypothetical protein [Flavipsychrobacter sp.]
MAYRFLIILLVVALAEYYSFVLIRSMVRGLPSPWRGILFSTYIGFTVLSWAGFFFFRAINWATLPPMARNMYIAIVLGFFVGKILIMLVMMIDDLRRLFTWGVVSMAGKNSPTADTVTAIDRSTFMKQAALVLGGVSLVGFSTGIT